MADLLFIEHAGQVEAARRRPPATRVIALAPEAMAELDRYGIEYCCPEDYVCAAAINREGLATYERVSAYCAALDDWLRAHDSRVERSGLRPATLLHYQFAVLAGAVTLRALEIEAILTEERPGRVRAFPAVDEDIRGDLGFHRESIYARLLPLLAGRRGVAVEWAGRATAPRPPAKERRLARLIPARWRQRLVQMRDFGLRSLGRSSGPASGTVLLLNATLDVRALMTAEPAADLRFVHWEGVGQPLTVRPVGAGRDLWLSSRRASAGWPLDVVSAVRGLVPDGVWPLVDRRVQHFAARLVPEMIASAEATAPVIEFYRPLVSLAGILGDHRVRAVAARARQLGVPLVVQQHGGSYGYLDLPVHYYNDLMHADWFLTYGEGVSADLRDRHGWRRPCAEMLAVGSAALARSARARTRNDVRRRLGLGGPPVLLYVATCMMGTRFLAPHYRSCDYFALLKRAVRALAEVEGVQVVVKVHQRGDNCYNPIAEWTKANAPGVRVITSGPLEPWLGASDLVAIDLPSTPLLEALTRGRRVIALFDETVFPLSARARASLGAEVQVEPDQGRFVGAVCAAARALAGGRRVGGAGADFLAAYGMTSESDRGAATALAHIIGAKQAHRAGQ